MSFELKHPAYEDHFYRHFEDGILRYVLSPSSYSPKERVVLTAVEVLYAASEAIAVSAHAVERRLYNLAGRLTRTVM